jgi:hypothetical protein
MKNKLLLSFMLIVCTLYSSFSISGSTGGLYLLVIPMDSGVVYKEDVDSFLRNIMA